MAIITPFRGLRYNQEAIGDLGLVVAPPYDVIDGAGRDSYYNRHPFNVIRLIMNRSKKSDADENAPYERASQFLRRWLDQRIIVQDQQPCLYLYRQRYLMEGSYRECTGIAARVRVEDFSDGSIKPHEDIMPKPLADRMKLLQFTGTNLSMVQALYSDPAEKLKVPIMEEMERFPLAQFQTGDGVAHDLWGVADERFIGKLATYFKEKTLYIADGHHRYQTALEYAGRLRESGELPDEDDPRNYLLMLIVEMENPGLSLLPVHRVVLSKRSYDVGELLGRLEKFFLVEELEVPKGARSGQALHLIKEIEKRSGQPRVFGMFSGEPERFIILTWKPRVDVEDVIGGEFSRDYKELDVTAIHKLIIEGMLGIPPDRESVEENLVFTRDPLNAVGYVDSGRGTMAFFLNPTRVQQVRDVADQGEKMPQKSTYFYPKPCSGVVMNKVNVW